MTPEQYQQFVEMYEWMQEKKLQQISAPLDEASLNNIGAAVGRGKGSTSLTQSVTVSSTPTNINVPNAYLGTIIIQIDGVRYEIPYLSTP